MATLILVRHGRTTANTSGTLAGRTAGVRLDELGHDQAGKAGERLAPVRLATVVTSPLERCRQTTRAIVAAQQADVPVVTDKGIVECDYGQWQGRPIKDLAKEPLWKTVQAQPSAAIFPGGESMLAMQARAVAAVRRHDAAVTAAHGHEAVWVAVSHGDVIKSILADALGMHLDLFQRLHVDPASISIIRYTDTRPFVLATNTHAGELGWLNPPPKKRRRQAGRAQADGHDDGHGDGHGDGHDDGHEDGHDGGHGDAVIGGGAGPGGAGPGGES